MPSPLVRKANLIQSIRLLSFMVDLDAREVSLFYCAGGAGILQI